MSRLAVALSALFFLGLAIPAAAQDRSCPVTPQPDTPFEFPEGFGAISPDSSSVFTHGTPDLWVQIRESPWDGLPVWARGHRQKLIWGSRNFRRTRDTFQLDPQPALEITGRRLDGDTPPLIVSGANSSHSEETGAFIVSGILFPTTGCWEITGRLGRATTTFVVEVR